MRLAPVALLALIAVACVFGPSAAELDAYLDRLNLDSAWELQEEEIVETGECVDITETCPRAVRRYRVSKDEYQKSVQILEDAGYTTEELWFHCRETVEEGCRVQGWNDEVLVTFVVVSISGSEVEVQLRAKQLKETPPSGTTGDPPT